MPLNEQKQFLIAPIKAQDIRRLVDIEFHAFENERVNQVLSYRDYKKPAHFERTVEAYETALNSETFASWSNEKQGQHQEDTAVELRTSKPKVVFRKVVDVETNEIISFAKFEIKTYCEEELCSPVDCGHEHEPKLNRGWFALNERLRREYVGQAAHCCKFHYCWRQLSIAKANIVVLDVSMLATEPKNQHNGAGTMLLQEVLSEADNAGLEVYLEATDTAKSFYEKHGFEAVTELRFDPAEYGVKGLGVERQTVMVKGALGQSGERKAVRPWAVAVAHTKAQL